MGTVMKLLEEKSRRDTEKKVESLAEQAAQDVCYIELDIDMAPASSATATRSSPVSSILVLAAAAPLKPRKRSNRIRCFISSMSNVTNKIWRECLFKLCSLVMPCVRAIFNLHIWFRVTWIAAYGVWDLIEML
jgi:hypothetical protein